MYHARGTSLRRAEIKECAEGFVLFCSKEKGIY